MEKNSQIFEDEEENKLEYMDIFKQYKKTLEKYIMTVFHLYILRVMISLQELANEIKGFSQERFIKLLNSRIDEIDE